MTNQIVERLLLLFQDLESAIQNSKKLIAEKENPSAELLERVATYSEILAKQRLIAEELPALIEKSDWLAVTHSIKQINELTLMIRDDAREAISPVDIASKFCN